MIGLTSSLVISQPDAVSNMAVRTFDMKLAVHMTVNATWPKGPDREGAGWVGALLLMAEATITEVPDEKKLTGKEATVAERTAQVAHGVQQCSDTPYRQLGRKRCRGCVAVAQWRMDRI